MTTRRPATFTLVAVTREGFTVGLDLSRHPEACPYMRKDPEIRDAWMAGFHQGRIVRRELPARGPHARIGGLARH